MLGNYSGESIAVIVYAANLAAVSARLRRPDQARAAPAVSSATGPSPTSRRFAGVASYLVAGVFLASIPVALVSPTAATLLWLAIFVGGPIADRIAGHEPSK